MKEHYLRPDDIAASLQVSRAAVYRLIASGKLVGLRIGSSVRVSATEFDRWLAGQPRAARRCGQQEIRG